MDKAEESLFLTGYSFLSSKDLPDSTGMIYSFSNRKKTIGTAKAVKKGIYFKEPLKSFVEYITYDRNEFEALRRLMINRQFTRDDRGISENSDFSSGNLRVNFEVTTDEYENSVYETRLSHVKAIVGEKAVKKFSLKDILKQ